MEAPLLAWNRLFEAATKRPLILRCSLGSSVQWASLPPSLAVPHHISSFVAVSAARVLSLSLSLSLSTFPATIKNGAITRRRRRHPPSMQTAAAATNYRVRHLPGYLRLADGCFCHLRTTKSVGIPLAKNLNIHQTRKTHTELSYPGR